MGKDSVLISKEYFRVWLRKDRIVAKSCHQILAGASCTLKHLAESRGKSQQKEEEMTRPRPRWDLGSQNLSLQAWSLGPKSF